MEESEKGVISLKDNKKPSDEIMWESRPLPSYLSNVKLDGEIGEMDVKQLASVSYQLYTKAYTNAS